MGIARRILTRMFGRPSGIMGRLGGRMMARGNRACAAWVIDLLGAAPSDHVLEIGFGPGVAIALLTTRITSGDIAGVDPSAEMLAQASARNQAAVERGRVALHIGSVERLPFSDETFDKALAINSMQVWPDAVAGLCEVRRVLKRGGTLALGFSPYSGQPKHGLAERLGDAGFSAIRVLEDKGNICALAAKP